MKANVLIPLFEPVNSTLVSTAGLNELNLIKLKLPSKEELIGIVEGKSEMYNHRIALNFLEFRKSINVPLFSFIANLLLIHKSHVSILQSRFPL